MTENTKDNEEGEIIQDNNILVINEYKFFLKELTWETEVPLLEVMQKSEGKHSYQSMSSFLKDFFNIVIKIEKNGKEIKENIVKKELRSSYVVALMNHFAEEVTILKKN